MLNFKRFLLEYLTDEQRKRFAHIKMTPKAREDTDHFFGKDNDHVRHEIDMDHNDKSEVHREVERHLSKDISHEEYRNSKVKDKYGREVSIGKLVKDNKLRDKYSVDRERHKTAPVSHHYSTTVRGTEVAGQTNSAPNKLHPSGHSWGNGSCKNVDTGRHKDYLYKEIEHGTVVTRIHDHDGKEIYRATHQPHYTKSGHVIYDVNSEYGLKHPAFSKHAHKISEMLSHKMNTKEKSGSIHPSVYNDSGSEVSIHPSASSEDLDHVLKSGSEDEKISVMKHQKATDKHIMAGVSDHSHLVATASVRNHNVTPEHLHQALKHRDWAVRYTALKQRATDSSHIESGLKDSNTMVRMEAEKQKRLASKK